MRREAGWKAAVQPAQRRPEPEQPAESRAQRQDARKRPTMQADTLGRDEGKRDRRSAARVRLGLSAKTCCQRR